MKGIIVGRRTKHTPLILKSIHLFHKEEEALKWAKRDYKRRDTTLPFEKAYQIIAVSSREDADV